MSTERSEPVEPLPDTMAELLATFAAGETLPDDARARIWKTIGGEQPPGRRSAPVLAAAPTRGHFVVGGLVAAAAAIALWMLVGAPNPTQRVPSGAGNAAAMEAARGGTDGNIAPPAGAPDGGRGAGLRSAEPEPEPEPEPGDAASPSPTPPAFGSARAGKDPTRSRRTDVAPVAREPEPPPTTLAAEQILIANAWGALTGDDPARALALASEHRRKFPDGVLAPERAAVVAIARCRTTPSAADATLRHYIAANAGSPLAARVRQACMPPPRKVDSR